MKALTIWQPWASLIMAGAKPYEFRGHAAPGFVQGQRIAIHAGKRGVKKDEVYDLIVRLKSDAAWTTCLVRAIALPLLELVLERPGMLPLSSILGTAVLGVRRPAERQRPRRALQLRLAARPDRGVRAVRPGPRRARLLGLDGVRSAMTAFAYRYRWDRHGRKGEPCRVTARSKISQPSSIGPELAFGGPRARRFNSIRVEFADSYVMITSGNSIRRNETP